MAFLTLHLYVRCYHELQVHFVFWIGSFQSIFVYVSIQKRISIQESSLLRKVKQMLKAFTLQHGPDLGKQQSNKPKRCHFAFPRSVKFYKMMLN